MKQMIYRVYGEDTFAHETFMVAEFKTREAAEKKLAECRASVMDQCEELRDTFWIVECTPKQVEEADRREAREREERMNARYYDKELLKQDLETLLAMIGKQLQGKHLSFSFSMENLGHDAEAGIPNSSNRVNYDAIRLYADSYDNGNCNLNIAVYLGGYKASNLVAGFGSEDELLTWLHSEQSLQDAMATVEHLIELFFE